MPRLHCGLSVPTAAVVPAFPHESIQYWSHVPRPQRPAVFSGRSRSLPTNPPCSKPVSRAHPTYELRSRAGAVAEIQGLYGSFSFPEKLLQKIWLRGDFDLTGLVALDGRRVRVWHPGKWNFLGGPDFKGARLSFAGGPVIVGDVELHLNAGGWAAHGHASDRAYAGVVLHVVLFPPEPGHVTMRADGSAIPVVALLPLLHHDLEQFAAEEAVELLANRPASRIHEELAALPAEELAGLLCRHAKLRWQQKVGFARVRVQRLGWPAACHHAVLEILGYRFNRAPMLRLAAARPLEEWTKPAATGEAFFASEAGRWSLQGVRPANHPRLRLRQYADWVRERPDWPARLLALADALPAQRWERTTAAVRRLGQFTKLRTAMAAGVGGDNRRRHAAR